MLRKRRQSATSRAALDEIASSNSHITSPLPSRRSSANTPTIEEALGLFDSAHKLAGDANFSGTLDLVVRYLHQLLPADLCVLYAYDANTDNLAARHVTGVGGAHVRGLRIELGHRLSGRVAANRRTIVNSDPVLDLGELSRSISPPLRSSLVPPWFLR